MIYSCKEYDYVIIHPVIDDRNESHNTFNVRGKNPRPEHRYDVVVPFRDQNMSICHFTYPALTYLCICPTVTKEARYRDTTNMT
jgi:hypothetical protein